MRSYVVGVSGNWFEFASCQVSVIVSSCHGIGSCVGFSVVSCKPQQLVAKQYSQCNVREFNPEFPKGNPWPAWRDGDPHTLPLRVRISSGLVVVRVEPLTSTSSQCAAPAPPRSTQGALTGGCTGSLHHGGEGGANGESPRVHLSTPEMQ